jgi:hypothetical protein
MLDLYRMAHKSNPWKKSTAKARPLALAAKQSSIPSGGERNSARNSDVRKHRAVPLSTYFSAWPPTLLLSRGEFGFVFPRDTVCSAAAAEILCVVLTLAAVGTLQMRWKWKKKRQRRLQRRRRKMRARSK